jgi:hypothetical protein
VKTGIASQGGSARRAKSFNTSVAGKPAYCLPSRTLGRYITEKISAPWLRTILDVFGTVSFIYHGLDAARPRIDRRSSSAKVSILSSH